MGAKGSFIRSRGSTRFIDAVSTKVVDTTGAGDLYASGFLYGLSKGYPLELSGKIASALASKVVSRIGARVGKESAQEVLLRVLKEHGSTN